MITDEVLDAFVTCGTPHEIGPRLRERYGDVVHRLSFDNPARLDPDVVQTVITSLHGERS
jgi:hypothetical protein